jgi:hypothetical protein
MSWFAASGKLWAVPRQHLVSEQMRVDSKLLAAETWSFAADGGRYLRLPGSRDLQDKDITDLLALKREQRKYRRRNASAGGMTFCPMPLFGWLMG